ncbi:MAG: DNA polymerase III subunit delta [Agathobaculum sp.]|jgi:DNA polymerase-3 subunit delta|uniref:DNA polymerase III subunit delta n=1 Tax=Agathobaculum sp. TaxID=2048138 RepID=UPI003D90A8DD
MAVEKGKPAGRTRLTRDLKDGTFSSLYIFSGEETYLKEYYLNELKKQVVEPAFADFNLIEFEGKGLTPEQLSEAIDSYPAMAEKKLIIVRDFDLFKPPAAFADVLLEQLSDLPEYVCLVFYYDILEGKPDKRTKLYKALEKNACFVEFSHLEERELVAWIERQVRALGCTITPDNAAYMIFLCGNSMTNLSGEIEKAASHSTTGEIQKYNIDSVCSPVLDAVVFDLTDAITAGKFDRAVALVGELIAQKNNEVMIFTTITRHIQRLYAAKLCDTARGGEKVLMEMIGSKSPYYARQIQNAARRVSLEWLRIAASECAKTDTALKSSAADKQKQIELCLLTLASALKEGRK